MSLNSKFSKNAKSEYGHLTVVELLVRVNTAPNYRILEGIARRISKETGWEIALGNCPPYGNNDGKIHLKAEVPYVGYRDYRRYLKGLAQEYSKILTPFFK